MSSLLTSTNGSLPKLSGSVWLLEIETSSLMFLFYAIIEYAMTNYLSRLEARVTMLLGVACTEVRRKKAQTNPDVKLDVKKNETITVSTSAAPDSSPVSTGQATSSAGDVTITIEAGDARKVSAARRRHSTNAVAAANKINDSPNCTLTVDEIMTEMKSVLGLQDRLILKTVTKEKNCWVPILRLTADQLDRGSRFIYPLACECPPM